MLALPLAEKVAGRPVDWAWAGEHIKPVASRIWTPPRVVPATPVRQASLVAGIAGEAAGALNLACVVAHRAQDPLDPQKQARNAVEQQQAAERAARSIREALQLLQQWP